MTDAVYRTGLDLYRFSGWCAVKGFQIRRFHRARICTDAFMRKGPSALSYMPGGKGPV